jgi:hypothetical protein
MVDAGYDPVNRIANHAITVATQPPEQQEGEYDAGT